MRKKIIRFFNYILIISLTVTVVIPISSQTIRAEASAIKDLENEINKGKENINNINNTISHLSDEQDVLEETIADLNSEIINMMTSIGLKEDEIAGKEVEIQDKTAEIAVTQGEYEAAKLKEEKQFDDMKNMVQFIYEDNNSTFISMFLDSTDINDLINKAYYVSKIYDYAEKKLEEYKATKNQIHDLWDKLEQDKLYLEETKSQLEQDKQNLQNQKAEQDRLLAKKKQESANFDAEIQRYKQEAAAAKKKLQQEQQQLKKLQEQQKPISNAAHGNYQVTAFDTKVIDDASGSDLGKKIAKYGCQFIGNPYVAGGTSLTNGADCSGFTYRIYKDFGYNIPRTSYEQRSAGTGVSYDQAQPGDIVCYQGHVGIYVGGGYIVHASTARTGIKISTATYREILSVRRII